MATCQHLPVSFGDQCAKVTQSSWYDGTAETHRAISMTNGDFEAHAEGHVARDPLEAGSRLAQHLKIHGKKDDKPKFVHFPCALPSTAKRSKS